MSTTPLQEELLALIGRLEVVAVELIAAQVHLDKCEFGCARGVKSAGSNGSYAIANGCTRMARE